MLKKLFSKILVGTLSIMNIFAIESCGYRNGEQIFIAYTPEGNGMSTTSFWYNYEAFCKKVKEQDSSYKVLPKDRVLSTNEKDIIKYYNLFDILNDELFNNKLELHTIGIAVAGFDNSNDKSKSSIELLLSLENYNTTQYRKDNDAFGGQLGMNTGYNLALNASNLYTKAISAKNNLYKLSSNKEVINAECMCNIINVMIHEMSHMYCYQYGEGGRKKSY